MTVKALTISTSQVAPHQAWIASWGPMANGDTGAPFEAPSSGDRSVQVTGTFGAAGSVSIEGSNDGTNWATLRDPANGSLAITAASIRAVMELTRYIRPNVTAGDGTTSLTITLLANSMKRG